MHFITHILSVQCPSRTTITVLVSKHSFCTQVLLINLMNKGPAIEGMVKIYAALHFKVIGSSSDH